MGWLAPSCLLSPASCLPQSMNRKNPAALVTVTATWALKSSKLGTVWDASVFSVCGLVRTTCDPRRGLRGRGLILLV